MNPSLIVKREKPYAHYELHFSGHVEFWTLKGMKLGESLVEVYP